MGILDRFRDANRAGPTIDPGIIPTPADKH